MLKCVNFNCNKHYSFPNMTKVSSIKHCNSTYNAGQHWFFFSVYVLYSIFGFTRGGGIFWLTTVFSRLDILEQDDLVTLIPLGDIQGQTIYICDFPSIFFKELRRLGKLQLLRILASYELKIAKICNLWTFISWITGLDVQKLQFFAIFAS